MIDTEALLHEKSEMKRVSDDVGEVRRRLLRHRSEIKEAWQSNESNAIYEALGELSTLLRRISEDLNDLGQDLLVSGKEIQEEESLLASEEESE